MKDDKDGVVQRFHSVIAQYSPMGDDVEQGIHKIGVASNYNTPSRFLSIEELPLALAYIVLHEGDFLEAIKDGVSSGRDTDSIGVMIGAILGAMHGIEALPVSEIAILEETNKQDIEEHCNRFIETAALIINNDMDLHSSRQQHMHSLF
jgi:hypothetical protein